MTAFAPDIVSAVLHHMNDDHVDDSLLIARAFGDDAATSSTMTALDEHAGTWRYTAADGEHELTVPWSERLTERPQIRREIVRLYEQACHRLGVEPRPQAG